MKSKIGSLLLALLIAFALWSYVITSVSPGSEETFYNIPVAWEGESVLQERGLMITQVSDTSVNMTLSGTRQDLVKVNSGNITLKVDVSRIYEPGTHSLNYTTAFPGDVASNAFVQESRYPESITFVVEERRTKEVPVEVSWIGSAPEGFLTDRENRELDYPSVTVVGPASVADRIEKAVIEVDLTDRRESISESYRYTLCDGEGTPVDAELIKTNVEEIRLDVKIQRFKDIKLTYNLVPGGGATDKNVQVALSVDTIRVSGSESALDTLGDELVIGTLKLAELTGMPVLRFPVSLPEGITNLTGVTEVDVTVHFSGLSTKTFTVTEFDLINIPEGLVADVMTGELKVEIRGPSAVLQKLTAEDIVVTVDLEGAEEGGANTYKAAVSFEGAGFAALGALRSYNVTVGLSSAE